MIQAMTGAPPVPARPFVLLDDSLADGGARLFRSPERVIRCDRAAAVPGALRELEEAVRSGRYAAGFMAYELGYLLEPSLATLFPETPGQPLLWFGVFAGEERLARQDVADVLGTAECTPPESVCPTLDRDGYLSKFDRVKDFIAAGDVYQVNLTFKHRFRYGGDPLALYRELRRQQPVRHGALIATDSFHVLSFSPELFLHVRDGEAAMRPMKGTIARGRSVEEDAALVEFLRCDEKSRAENLMILDLMRNDLGRIADVGSVSVTDMYTVETYRTLHQMTSGVRARLRNDIGLAALLRQVFPCGSVTGAPKIRAMEIIRALEAAPRGVYTGAIGAFGPDGSVDLNVAIRTLFIDANGGAEMGIGSGVVQDSDGPSEYDECLLKARFLTCTEAPFQLIETLRWSAADGYWLLAVHLDRLSASARYFGFRCDTEAVRTALIAAARRFDGSLQRVRLALDSDGRWEITAVPIAPAGKDAAMRYVIADESTESGDRFLYHKTTRRRFYDGTRERLADETGCDEVLFVNERGELTEGSFTNLFVVIGGRWLTPPLSCGLLDGTLRRHLLTHGQPPVEERVLFPDDLAAADEVWLGNSVRGLVRGIANSHGSCSRMERTAGEGNSISR